MYSAGVCGPAPSSSQTTKQLPPLSSPPPGNAVQPGSHWAEAWRAKTSVSAVGRILGRTRRRAVGTLNDQRGIWCDIPELPVSNYLEIERPQCQQHSMADSL